MSRYPHAISVLKRELIKLENKLAKLENYNPTSDCIQHRNKYESVIEDAKKQMSFEAGDKMISDYRKEEIRLFNIFQKHDPVKHVDKITRLDSQINDLREAIAHLNRWL